MSEFHSNNPIIRGRGVCDPHVHIFDGIAYLYASHDFSPSNQDWIMKDWQIWSSLNLIDWKLESTFRPEDTYIGATSKCWAVDAAQRHGKFFYYFSNANIDTGVAVSDRPGSGFADALGKALLPGDLTDSLQYDPTVFIDDDAAATPYLIWGCGFKGNGYYIARLGEDMISLAEPPVSIKVSGFKVDDKSFLHKQGGRYYLSWASFYAVADNVYGPYEYKGTIGASEDHGSFFSWRNQTFNAFTIFDPSYFHRASGLCYIHYRTNGEMVADPMIVEHGIGSYDARWNKIEAEWYMAAEGVTKRENHWRGFEIVAHRDGARVYFPNIRNLRENTGITFFAVCNSKSGAVIEVRTEGPTGPLLGTCSIGDSGTLEPYGYRTHSCQLQNAPGMADLHFILRCEAEDALRIDWFKFS